MDGAPRILLADGTFAAALALLHGSAFADRWDEASFRNFLHDEHCRCWITCPEEEQVPFGFLLVRAVLDEAEVLSIGVSPDRQGLGVGAHLLGYGLSSLVQQGVARVFLEVAEDNEAAIKLYHSFGFEEFGRRKGYFRRKGADESVDGLNLCCRLSLA